MSKTAEGLIAHAKSLMGSPYMWGTYGKRITNDLINRKAAQYKSRYTAAYIKKLRGYAGSGKRAVDCVGLIKAYMMTAAFGGDPVYVAKYDKNVSGMRSACKTKGKIATLPETPGALLFMGTSHVGIYLGGGKAIEAKGSAEVMITTVKGRGWDSWGLLDWITYPKTAKPTADSAEIKPGDSVQIKPGAEYYYPGGGKIPDYVLGRKYTAGSERMRNSARCVLLKEINSSADINILTKV